MPAEPAQVAPADWAEAFGVLTGGGARRILVIGPNDAGKSTFCRLLIEAMGEQGRAVLLDADVGQKMVGPPAAVTMASADAPDCLRSLAFVGTVNPIAGFGRVIAGLTRLLAGAEGAPLVVNTSGLLAGAGRRLKAAKIDALKPDILVALGRDPALDLILDDHPSIPTLRLPSPPDTCRKSPARRRLFRREAYRRYFDCAPLLELDLAADARIGLRDGLLVGLVDEHGTDLAMGLVAGFAKHRGSVRVRSPYRGLVAALIPGSLCLGPDYDASASPCPGGTISDQAP